MCMIGVVMCKDEFICRVIASNIFNFKIYFSISSIQNFVYNVRRNLIGLFMNK